jgi:hypothetical protein
VSTAIPYLVRTGQKLLRPAELAALFGVRPSEVHDLTWRGLIPVALTTPGGHARFRWPEVEFARPQAPPIPKPPPRPGQPGGPRP